MNGKLRSSKPDELLDTILTPDGSVSPHFPKDLRSLFNLDGNTSSSFLLLALQFTDEVHS
jgi:hypothetical protein